MAAIKICKSSSVLFCTFIGNSENVACLSENHILDYENIRVCKNLTIFSWVADRV